MASIKKQKKKSENSALSLLNRSFSFHYDLVASFFKVTVRVSLLKENICYAFSMKVRSALRMLSKWKVFMVEEHMHNVLSDKERRICKVVEG